METSAKTSENVAAVFEAIGTPPTDLRIICETTADVFLYTTEAKKLPLEKPKPARAQNNVNLQEQGTTQEGCAC